MTLTHQTVLDEDGKPTAAIIPWDVFLRMREALEGISPDDEATPEILEAIAEAERDRSQGNTDAFTSLEDLRAEFAVTDAKG